MAMKDYSDEFKADAVALYESTPGATYKSIAADLGVLQQFSEVPLPEAVLLDAPAGVVHRHPVRSGGSAHPASRRPSRRPRPCPIPSPTL